MSASTLVSRVARVQTVVGALALALVLAGTLALVDALLSWKTDQHLVSVVERAAKYLEAAEPETLDWRWFEREVEEVRPHNVRVVVEDRQGRLRLAAGAGQGPAAPAGSCVSRGSVRGCTLAYRGFVLRASRDRADDREVEWQIALALLGACVMVGIGIALSSRAVTRRAIRPLLELTARVQAVEPGTGERSGFRSDLAELDTLGRRFDDLVQRFDAALAREKRFSAEASHELRTPLTIARAELEELIASSTHDPQALARAVSSIDRLSSLVDALLWFARAQGRLDTEHLEVVNVADVVRDELEAVGRMHPLQATDRSIPDEALVRGDEELLRRAVANLLENAAKHGDGAPAAVGLVRSGDRLELSISNGGRPIPAQLREEIFTPFFRYRGDEHTAGGFGLGLPFARAVARAHGGELEHGPSRKHDVEMLLTLPLVDWNDA